jgi:hypothetical protein
MESAADVIVLTSWGAGIGHTHTQRPNIIHEDLALSMWLCCSKEVIVIHDCGTFWPSPISTPTGIEDLDLQAPSVVRNENGEIRKKNTHTTARRGRKFLSLPPPRRPLHTLLSPPSQTSGRSKASGLSSKFSSLTYEIDGSWPSLEAAVGVVHRARRAAK